jgi:hypothetical protein
LGYFKNYLIDGLSLKMFGELRDPGNFLKIARDSGGFLGIQKIYFCTANLHQIKQQKSPIHFPLKFNQTDKMKKHSFLDLITHKEINEKGENK